MSLHLLNGMYFALPFPFLIFTEKSPRVVCFGTGRNPPFTTSNPSSSYIFSKGRPRGFTSSIMASDLHTMAYAGFASVSPSTLSAALAVQSLAMWPGFPHFKHGRFSFGTSGFGHALQEWPTPPQLMHLMSCRLRGGIFGCLLSFPVPFCHRPPFPRALPENPPPFLTKARSSESDMLCMSSSVASSSLGCQEWGAGGGSTGSPSATWALASFPPWSLMNSDFLLIHSTSASLVVFSSALSSVSMDVPAGRIFMSCDFLSSSAGSTPPALTYANMFSS